MTDKLLYEQDGHIATLTFNMPETRNALTDKDMCEAIVDAMHRINNDQSVRCAIVTGAGKAFSSGGNLKHMKEKVSIFGGDAIDAKDGYRNGIQQVAKAMWECEVPLIAAVRSSESIVLAVPGSPTSISPREVVSVITARSMRASSP